MCAGGHSGHKALSSRSRDSDSIAVATANANTTPRLTSKRQPGRTDQRTRVLLGVPSERFGGPVHRALLRTTATERDGRESPQGLFGRNESAFTESAAKVCF